MLTLEAVDLAYGRVQVVRSLSLRVNRGEIVGLLGHNGAGKTTTLLAVAGVLRPIAGSITFEGRSIVGLRPEDVVRRGIGLVPENRQIFTRLTVGENLRIGGSSLSRAERRGLDRRIQKMVERFPVLGKYFNRPAGTLSGGEQQQLAIARALVPSPKLVLMDEPSLGLSPVLVDQVFGVLDSLRKEGATVFVVEQNAARTVQTADRTYVMRSGGQIVLHGTREELRNLDDLPRYLGIVTVGARG